MNLPVDEIISRHHLLSPRDAASLTLAIGRAWERERNGRDHEALPDASCIELTPGGEIAFTEPARGTPATTHTLSALLGQLLGLDDDDTPRQPIPGGLLITIAGRLGPMELPSSHDEGFMSALVRFADERPATLAALYQRMIAARRDGETLPVRTAAVKVRRGRDRRRQPPEVAALRRAVRDLERQTFEAKAINAQARALTRASQFSRGARTRDRFVTAAIALLMVAAGFLIRATGLLGPFAAEPSTRVTRVVPIVREHEAESLHPRHVAEVKAVSPRPSASRAAHAHGRRPASTQPHLVFVGGSRPITWVARPAQQPSAKTR